MMERQPKESVLNDDIKGNGGGVQGNRNAAASQIGKNQQHSALMSEFKRVHERMFKHSISDNMDKTLQVNIAY